MSRSSDSNDDAGLRNTQTEIKVPKNIESSFSNDDVGKDTELPDEIVEISSKLIDGASQKDVADDFSVHRNTVRKVVESMKEAGLIRVSGRGRGAEYHAKGILEDDLKNDPLTEDSKLDNDNASGDNLRQEYPSGLGGEIIRAIDRGGTKKRSVEHLSRRLGADKEQVEAAVYRLHDVDLLRTWKTDEGVFTHLNSNFEEELNFEPDKLTEEHLGVFFDTLRGYSLSEIEERREPDKPLEARRDLEYLLEEADTDGASVEYEPTEIGAATLGLFYAHLSAGNDYPALEMSPRENEAVEPEVGDYEVRGKKLWQRIRSNKVPGDIVDPEHLIKGSMEGLDESRNSGNVQKLVDTVEEAGGFLEFDSLASELNISDYMMGRTLGEACFQRDEVYMEENGVRYEGNTGDEKPGWTDFANS